MHKKAFFNQQEKMEWDEKKAISQRGREKRRQLRLLTNFHLLSLQELAISSTEKRNWRGICIALLVISAVLSIIVFSIFLLSPGKRASVIADEIKSKAFLRLKKAFHEILHKISLSPTCAVSNSTQPHSMEIYFASLSMARKKWHSEIEDTRIYGRRLLLSDIYNDSLKWKPFNGSWINGKCM